MMLMKALSCIKPALKKITEKQSQVPEQWFHLGGDVCSERDADNSARSLNAFPSITGRMVGEAGAHGRLFGGGEFEVGS